MSAIQRVTGVRSSSAPSPGGRDPVGQSSGDALGGDGEGARHEEAYRRHVRDRLGAELRSERDRMRQAGRYCYEGAWLTPEEIMARIRARRREEWARLLEMVLLLLGLCGAAFVFYKLLILLA